METPDSSLNARITYLPDVHRLLPQAADAEQGLLSSFLLAPKEVGGLCAERKASPQWFHVPAHAEIFGVLVEFWDGNRPLDCITMAQTLRDRNKLDAVGGFAFLSGLFTFLPTAANARYYLEIVHAKYRLREVIRVGTEYAARSYDEQGDTETLLDGFEREVMAIRKDTDTAATDYSAKDLAMAAVGDIQLLYERRGKIGGLGTGFTMLDQMTDGLQGSELYVIAARPSMGKTAFAMNMAEHVAFNLKKPVGVFSLEMSARQLARRILCSQAHVNPARVRDGFLSERDFPALTAAAARFAASGLHIDDRSSLSIAQVRAKGRRWKMERDVQAIFIDYLQLMRSTTKRGQDNRQQEISEISGGLKALSKELDIPIVVLAQLNRNPDARGGDKQTKGRPRLSDLRESGSIEQDADFVGLLHREAYYAETEEDKQDAQGKAVLIVAKQRNGPVGDVPLTFLKEFTRFEDRAESAEPEPANPPKRNFHRD